MARLRSIGERDDDINFESKQSKQSHSASSDSSCASCPELSTFELDWGEHIGAGHTCDVFRGHYSGKEVAIKQFRANKGNVHDESLAREIAVMCLVRHPNIVLLYGVITTEPPLQIIMEYCHGGSCFELLHQQRKIKPTWSQMLKMCLHVAVAMDYLHRFNPCIIHRDLKSLNILLDQPLIDARSAPITKVADFGLARMLDNQSAEPLTLGVGTNQWMAPEIVCGSRYDEKVDVYSFAMVLYEITCKKIPFLNEQPMELRRLVLAGKRPDLSHMASQCPGCIRELIQVCWAGNARKRPPFKEVCQVINSARTQSVIVSL
jgi:serine/threonine protein kinase